MVTRVKFDQFHWVWFNFLNWIIPLELDIIISAFSWRKGIFLKMPSFEPFSLDEILHYPASK